jgi:enterochelin esterase-like enzyme
MSIRTYLAALTFFVSVVSLHAQSATDTTDALPQSAQLAALSTALDNDKPGALAEFWASVAKQHSPLVEELPNRPDDALYTFLWRADLADDVVNVRIGAVFPTRSDNDAFQRLGKTNVWYTSYVLPKSARLIYRIRAPQGMQPSPLARDRFTVDGVRYEMFRDPLNPSVFPEGSVPPDDQSIVEGPTATQNQYVAKRPDISRGTLKEFDIDSNLVGGKRTTTVYTPAGYAQATAPYAFMLVLDAEAYIGLVSTPTILDNMISQSVIPPLVVAFVHSDGTRDTDLPPNADFQNFIGAELMPWIRERYRVSRDPKLNVVAGSSFGGLAAAYTAFIHPETFGEVISQSGSYWWSPQYLTDPAPSPNAGWMIKQFAESPRKAIRFYMDAGAWEPAGMLHGNRMLVSVLKGKGYTVSYREFLGGHYYAYWQQTLPDALIAVLGTKTH